MKSGGKTEVDEPLSQSQRLNQSSITNEKRTRLTPHEVHSLSVFLQTATAVLEKHTSNNERALYSPAVNKTRLAQHIFVRTSCHAAHVCEIRGVWFRLCSASRCTLRWLVRGYTNICIAIDAIERKRNIDTNLLTQQIALAAHESHFCLKSSDFFHVRSFVPFPAPI